MSVITSINDLCAPRRYDSPVVRSAQQRESTSEVSSELLRSHRSNIRILIRRTNRQDSFCPPPPPAPPNNRFWYFGRSFGVWLFQTTKPYRRVGVKVRFKINKTFCFYPLFRWMFRSADKIISAIFRVSTKLKKQDDRYGTSIRRWAQLSRCRIIFDVSTNVCPNLNFKRIPKNIVARVDFRCFLITVRIIIT